MAPVSQGQFTPLPEALCWAILELTSQRQAATLDTLRSALRNAFPAMQRPSRELVYDALAKLMQERKIYHTSQGYFVVTPETKRLRRDSGSSRRCSRDVNGSRGQGSMLMSNDEAVALVHGEMLTLRDGDVTHQAVQTNLADVICGGKTSLANYFLSLTSSRSLNRQSPQFPSGSCRYDSRDVVFEEIYSSKISSATFSRYCS